MNKSEYHKYLKSQNWQLVRKHVLTRDEYKCRFCNSGLDLNVHHRSYEYIGREMQKLTDLTTVCKRCHSLLHVIEPTQSHISPISSTCKSHGAKSKVDAWGSEKVKRNTDLHYLLIARREAMQKTLLGTSQFPLCRNQLDLILTFTHGLTRLAEDFLEINGSVSGWKTKALGRTFSSSRFIALMEASTLREKQQLEL